MSIQCYLFYLKKKSVTGFPNFQLTTKVYQKYSAFSQNCGIVYQKMGSIVILDRFYDIAMIVFDSRNHL